jgi:hypothetical protein
MNKGIYYDARSKKHQNIADVYPRIFWELVSSPSGFEKHSLANAEVYGFIFAGFRGGWCSLTPNTQLNMRGSVPPLPIYSHTIWTGITVIYLYDCTVSPWVRSS